MAVPAAGWARGRSAEVRSPRLESLARFDVLVLTALLWFLAKFLRYAFPPLFEPLQTTYAVSNVTIGAAFTAFMLAYAAMQFPSGALADRVGSVRVIAGGALLAAAGAFALVVESPFPVLVGAMVVIGAGTGAHKTVAVRLLSRSYPARTGRALGVLDTIGTFGGVVAPPAIVLALGVAGPFGGAGWRYVFLAAGLFGIGLVLAFVRQAPRRVPERGSVTVERIRIRPYLTAFADHRFSLFVVVTLCYSFSYNGVVAFLPLYLTSEVGLGVATAGVLYSALFAASVAQLATGEASDRVGRLPIMALALGLSGAAIAFLSIGLPTLAGLPVAAGVVVVAIGLGAHGFRPVRSAYLVALLPPSLTGGGLGVVRTLLMGAGAVSPAVVGLLADAIGFRLAFALLAASMLAGSALVCLLWLTE